MSKGYIVADSAGTMRVCVTDGEKSVRVFIDDGSHWSQHSMCADDAYFIAWKILGIVKLIRQREANAAKARTGDAA